MATGTNDSLPLGGRSLAIFVVSTVMTSVSFVAVLLRSFVRLYLVRAFGWDDTLMVLALSLFVGFSTCCIAGSKAGVGHRMIEFTTLGPLTGPDMLEISMLWWWLGQILYVWSSTVAKVSIAMTLLRLAVRRFHRLILWTIITLSITIGLMFWLILFLDCDPISHFWRRVRPENQGKCLSTDILVSITYFYSSVTILCDLTLGSMPALLVWNLQMNRKTKVALGGILSLGAVASVAVIIRLPFLHHYKDADFLYSTYQIAIWSVIETGLGITAGSLVTLRPLFRWFLDGSISYALRGRSSRPSNRLYPLSSMGEAPRKGSRDPGYWRPDIPDEASKVVVTTISGPGTGSYLTEGHSSQEDLNPTADTWHPRYQVNVHKTFQVSAG